MKIGLCQFSQETNTFSPARLSFRDIFPKGFRDPETLIEEFRGTGTYLGGVIRAAEEENIELVPLPTADAEAGPLMTKECVDHIMDVICDALSAVKDELSGLLFVQHGGGCSEGYASLEAEALRRVRIVCGDLPVMSPLDLHCNLTPETLKGSDGLFPIKEFPHVDTADAGYRAMRMLVRTIRGEITPVMSWVSLPQIYPNTTTCTLMEPMKSVRAHFAAYAKEHGLLDASVCQGFSGGDQYWSGVSVLVTADGRTAETEARELAEYLWSRREDFEPRRLAPKEAIAEALSGRKEGYAVIHESTDNPGSGCPGDGTHLLRELIEEDVPGSVFMHMYDPETAAQAHAAGVGAEIRVKLGGKTVPLCGEPVELTVKVMALSDGEARFASPMNQNLLFHWGKSCRLRHKNVEIVVTSALHQSLDDTTLSMTGGNITDYRLVCLKSAGHFRAWFQERADVIVTTETPGLRSTDLSSYPYEKIRRPVFPLEKEGKFPAAEVTSCRRKGIYTVKEGLLEEILQKGETK